MPVGTYPGGANWVGAEDMAGNAMEWVADWLAVDDYRHYGDPPEYGDRHIGFRIIAGRSVGAQSD